MDIDGKFSKTLKKRRDEMAQKYYDMDYMDLCSRRKKIVDDVIGVKC